MAADNDDKTLAVKTIKKGCCQEVRWSIPQQHLEISTIDLNTNPSNRHPTHSIYNYSHEWRPNIHAAHIYALDTNSFPTLSVVVTSQWCLGNSTELLSNYSLYTSLGFKYSYDVHSEGISPITKTRKSSKLCYLWAFDGRGTRFCNLNDDIFSNNKQPPND
ncbi:hypothetical protein FF38_01463 [Lucilia cuprina]|uniref:Uncharacterized protein n=1 Tax=Lucilia cuprina TaxID=7375 RepID=A0A0L0BVH9_LUCCU|nr:hypothetical protein FF38_01463 [Lucilia cuprina]